MSLYQLYDFDMVCETDFPGSGCGETLSVASLRSIRDAAEWAKSRGWTVFKPSPFDEDRRWTTICPPCAAAREQKLAEWKAAKEA